MKLGSLKPTKFVDLGFLEGYSKGMKKPEEYGIPRKSTERIDHWAFLEEIEAPMWVDLTLEAKSITQDKDDEWFSCGHWFHESSAHELMTAFSHSRYECLDTSFQLEGPSSPMLPPSVSRRGENYESRKWGINGRKVVLAKGCQVKSLSGRTSGIDTGHRQELKSKQCSKISKGIAKNERFGFTRSSNERTMTNNSKLSISFGVSNGTSSTMASHAGESNASSTVTSETGQHQQQRFMEVSSQLLGRNSGLLSSLKTSLRKSCVTRQAARVEINDQRLSRGRRSSSSKSSVGSSINPVCDADPSTTSPEEYRDQTPDSRHIHRVSQVADNSTKVRNTTSGATVFHGNRKSSSTVSGRSTITKTNSHESIKLKGVHGKPLRPVRVLERNSVAVAPTLRKKADMSRFSRVTNGGKKNEVGRVAPRTIVSWMDCAPGSIVQGQKVVRKAISHCDTGTGLAPPKGKIIGRKEGKCPANTAQKVFFR